MSSLFKNIFNKILFILFFLLFFLLKCSAPQVCEKCPSSPRQESLFVCVDSKFSNDNKLAVKEFSVFFTESFCGIIQAEIVYFDNMQYSDFCDVVVFRVLSSYEWVQNATTQNNLAFVNEINGLYVWIIEDKIYGELFIYVLTHEILHSLGVQHGDNIMKTKLKPFSSECIDRTTIIYAALEIGRRRGQRTKSEVKKIAF